MKQIRVPDFLQNLVRDLRDRRLLLPAIALLVALFAVPIVLKSNASTSTTSSGAPDTSGGDAARALPAVVTQELGVTDYRKRLNRLQSKNPFHQQYTATPDSAKLNVTSTGGSTASTGTGSSDLGTTSTGGSSTSPPVSSTPSTDLTGGTPPAPSSSSGSPDTSTPQPKPPKPTLYAFRVSIAIGEPGDLKRRENVSQGVILPSENKPMATFVGATEDMSKATFILANTIDDVQGGHCVPDRGSCSLLQLKPGQEVHLHYAPQNRRYNLKLIEIGLAPVKKSAVDGSSPSQKRADGNGVDGFPLQIGYGSVK
jgi:hypothetical protein